jgi:hypothetical protein
MTSSAEAASATTGFRKGTKSKSNNAAMIARTFYSVAAARRSPSIIEDFIR